MPWQGPVCGTAAAPAVLEAAAAAACLKRCSEGRGPPQATSRVITGASWHRTKRTISVLCTDDCFTPEARTLALVRTRSFTLFDCRAHLPLCCNRASGDRTRYHRGKLQVPRKLDTVQVSSSVCFARRASYICMVQGWRCHSHQVPTLTYVRGASQMER
jgi:hypothetical protein